MSNNTAQASEPSAVHIPAKPANEADMQVYQGIADNYMAPAPARAVEPLTDAMVVAAARMLNDRHAASCNVDVGDCWKMYGDDFIEDARAMLEAAHGIK